MTRPIGSTNARLRGPVSVSILRGTGCICGKHMFEHENAGTCLWCGHGSVQDVPERAYGLLASQPPIRAVSLTSVDVRASTSTNGNGRSHRTVWDEDACIAAYRAWEAAHGHAPSAMDWQAAKIRDDGVARPSYGLIRRLFGGWVAFKRAIAEVPRDQVTAA